MYFCIRRRNHLSNFAGENGFSLSHEMEAPAKSHEMEVRPAELMGPNDRVELAA